MPPAIDVIDELDENKTKLEQGAGRNSTANARDRLQEEVEAGQNAVARMLTRLTEEMEAGRQASIRSA